MYRIERINKMEYKNIIKPVTLISTALIGVYLLAKKGTKEDIEKVVETGNYIAKQAKESIKSFGNITQTEIDEIVANTYRGVKAEIDGDTLRYYFKSASGKSTPTSNYKIDGEGKLINTFLSYKDAKSPWIFEELLNKLIEEKKEK